MQKVANAKSAKTGKSGSHVYSRSYIILAGTRVNHTGVLAVSNYYVHLSYLESWNFFLFHYMDLTMQNLWTLQ